MTEDERLIKEVVQFLCDQGCEKYALNLQQLVTVLRGDVKRWTRATARERSQVAELHTDVGRLTTTVDQLTRRNAALLQQFEELTRYAESQHVCGSHGYDGKCIACGVEFEVIGN